MYILKTHAKLLLVWSLCEEDILIKISTRMAFKYLLQEILRAGSRLFQQTELRQVCGSCGPAVQG